MYPDRGRFSSVVVVLVVVVLFVHPVRRRSFLLCPELVPPPQCIEGPVSQRLHAGVPSVEVHHLYAYIITYGQTGKGKLNITTLT